MKYYIEKGKFGHLPYPEASITDASSLNRFIKNAVNITRKLNLSSPRLLFGKESKLAKIKSPLNEVTPWGFVAIKKVDVAKNYVSKLLIVKKLGILGFEIHNEKHEKLKILEGFCVVFFVNHKRGKKDKIVVKLAGRGDVFEFMPKDEHGLIAITDAVIEEQSTNNLDDLVYIFRLGQQFIS